ncbi:hypothetical protein BJX68DRAFT_267625 [Aspergillus pseudodeflectus]|uniref:Uncharacterized protein n=1 Tax=Aspergillus pseudodeflectus TaxID=176178 RepID=A0ABR4KAD3_9EURO
MEAFTKHRRPNSLRVVISTGATLLSDMYTWLNERAFPPTTHLISVSGGTDLCGSQILAKCLGMAIEVYDPISSDPSRVRDREFGELLWTLPFPSQPLSFYGAGGDEKYPSSYTARTRTARVSCAVVDAVREIEDSLCMGQQREFNEDEAVLLFAMMRSGPRLSHTLDIFKVVALPYTAKGKRCEINVKWILNGMDSAIGWSVVSLESLEGYKKYYSLPKHVIRHRTENKL